MPSSKRFHGWTNRRLRRLGAPFAAIHPGWLGGYLKDKFEDQGSSPGLGFEEGDGLVAVEQFAVGREFELVERVPGEVDR